MSPGRKKIWADAAYRGKELADWCKAQGDWDLEVVERTPGVRRFAMLPKGWIVERTFGWISRNCRMSTDDERKVLTVRNADRGGNDSAVDRTPGGIDVCPTTHPVVVFVDGPQRCLPQPPVRFTMEQVHLPHWVLDFKGKRVDEPLTAPAPGSLWRNRD